MVPRGAEVLVVNSLSRATVGVPASKYLPDSTPWPPGLRRVWAVDILGSAAAVPAAAAAGGGGAVASTHAASATLLGRMLKSGDAQQASWRAMASCVSGLALVDLPLLERRVAAVEAAPGQSHWLCLSLAPFLLPSLAPSLPRSLAPFLTRSLLPFSYHLI